MLIVGAKGFAKEALEIVVEKTSENDIVFYDDISSDLTDKLFDRFPILKNEEDARKYLMNFGPKFILGVGGPITREYLSKKFESFGGELATIISEKSNVGMYNTTISEGSIVMQNCTITNNINIGKGCLINIHSTIGHDSLIGDFVEICPSVNISGNVKIGNSTFIGTSATILPNITIGQNCVIGAGAVVTKNVPNNSIVKGIPAK